MNYLTIDHVCPTCGTHEIRYYTDRQYIEMGHDKFLLRLGLLECGNCENGIPPEQVMTPPDDAADGWTGYFLKRDDEQRGGA